MIRCVNSARFRGIFNEFQILTNSPIPQANSYELMEFDAAEGLFQILYLKLAMAKLNFDYFVWIDADTVFLRPPIGLLDTMSDAPIHVPLTPLPGPEPRHSVKKRMQNYGIPNPIHNCSNAFWVLHHDAIGNFCDLSLAYWHAAKEAGHHPAASEVIGAAAHLLYADPNRHSIDALPDLWTSADYVKNEARLSPHNSPTSQPQTGKQRQRLGAIHHLARGRQLSQYHP